MPRRSCCSATATSPGPRGLPAPAAAGMAFAAGMYVVPGGRRRPARLRRTTSAWAGPSARTGAARLHSDEALARALVCAAVRETFEESGVLLAGPSRRHRGGRHQRATTGRQTARRLEARELGFTDFLDRARPRAAHGPARCGAHWITPDVRAAPLSTPVSSSPQLPAGQRHPRRLERGRPGALARRAGRDPAVDAEQMRCCRRP